MDKNEINKLTFQELRERLILEHEVNEKLQKEAVYWNQKAILLENSVKSAFILCDSIKSVLYRFEEFKVRDFKNISKEKMIDMLLISIKDYVDLYLYVNTLTKQ